MYTTHGLMTGADYAEYLKDTDQGTTEIDPLAAPDWFDVPIACPLCDDSPENHDSYTVSDAGGTVIDCSETR